MEGFFILGFDFNENEFEFIIVVNRVSLVCFRFGFNDVFRGLRVVINIFG